MINKLKRKIHNTKINNIEIILGSFPEALPDAFIFNSIISSFAIVHFTKEERKIIYNSIFDHLISKGRIGLFSAQGEIASTFETKEEVVNNLKLAGFTCIEVDDVSDIYRIVKAERP